MWKKNYAQRSDEERPDQTNKCFIACKQSRTEGTNNTCLSSALSRVDSTRSYIHSFSVVSRIIYYCLCSVSVKLLHCLIDDRIFSCVAYKWSLTSTSTSSQSFRLIFEYHRLIALLFTSTATSERRSDGRCEKTWNLDERNFLSDFDTLLLLIRLKSLINQLLRFERHQETDKGEQKMKRAKMKSGMEERSNLRWCII